MDKYLTLDAAERETLAAACARERRYEFLFVSVPLNVTGAVGSPANAVAVL